MNLMILNYAHQMLTSAINKSQHHSANYFQYFVSTDFKFSPSVAIMTNSGHVTVSHIQSGK